MSGELPQDDDDRALLSAIADKDEEAFHRFYRRHCSTVYSLARRITGLEHEAEDVVADVFWELWDKSARYCPSKSSPHTYLVMLTRCRALDRKRGLARRQTHPILDWVADAQPLTGLESTTPDDQCSMDELRGIVVEAIKELEPNQRRAIELTFFDGLTHFASAETLGIPLGTLKGRVRAALDHLRKIMQVCRND